MYKKDRKYKVENKMVKLRKSTPAYVVLYSGDVVYGPTNRTSCKRFAARSKDLVVKKA